jgi:hypothetical protein
MTGGRVADRVAAALLPSALAAVALALLAPSLQIATRADLLLAWLGAAHRARHRRARAMGPAHPLHGGAGAALAPFLVLVPLAWVLSRLFDSPVREGVLTLGLS